jgi:ammonium transporter, Amt family
MLKTIKWIGATGMAAMAALPAFAQETAAKVAEGAAAATTAVADAAPAFVPTAEMVNKGDTAWMMTSSVLVLMMSVPALALFYGGLVRTKNMLSVLMQVFMIVSIAALVWVGWGYSMAFTSGGSGALAPFVGSFDKIFLKGVSATTFAATFSNGIYLPEYVFVIFQMTFACITPALIVGAFAERVKFSSLMVFTVLWLTVVYFPVAHMVWYWAGPDFLAPTVVKDAAGAIIAQDAGYLWGMGALDFAGGTVVHINAGIAGLVGCLMIGKRIGHGKEATPPHSLTMTMIGASLLWVGWFGFNAGSNLEANGVTAVAFINTFVATAAAAVSWAIVEQIKHGRPSLLGGVSGAVAGLVAITPASGFAHPGTSIILGFAVSPICYFFVSYVKNKFKYDDTLDVFGIHCIGGIVGALATAVVAAPSLGGQGYFDYTVMPAVAITPEAYSISAQLLVQLKAVLLTLAWSGIGSAILYFIIDKTMGLRPSEDAEREGLDLSSHGERAYNY